MDATTERTSTSGWTTATRLGEDAHRFQEGYRWPNGAAGLLDDQRPQLDGQAKNAEPISGCPDGRCVPSGHSRRASAGQGSDPQQRRRGNGDLAPMMCSSRRGLRPRHGHDMSGPARAPQREATGTRTRTNTIPYGTEANAAG